MRGGDTDLRRHSSARRDAAGPGDDPAARPDELRPDDAARAHRRDKVPPTDAGAAEPEGAVRRRVDPFRIDRDRIVASPFLARLGGVTQVVSPSGSGLLLHNRLTHSLKVAKVAVAVAEELAVRDTDGLLDRLGGLDLGVVEAAALAHDLGHPPFGHLGEQVLDRIAREQLGLPDGFEGNAQSFRIITTTDVRGPSAVGLNLTAAVRAAVLKYPWARTAYPSPHPSGFDVPPRGAAPSPAFPYGSPKFSAYLTELDDVQDCRAWFDERLEPWRQTVEAAVMDTADDIAYAIHDIEDFHRVGVLAPNAVAAELDGWLGESLTLANLDDAELAAHSRARPGYGLEALRRKLRRKDAWIADDDVFAEAVVRVSRELGKGLLARPFDGSVAAEQAVAEFSDRWTDRLISGVDLLADPPVRASHVVLAAPQWHEVQVLKFLHHRLVLQRPDLAMHQRGQARLLESLVSALVEWLDDAGETARLPRRLHDLVELAQSEYAALAAEAPEWLGGDTGDRPGGRGRSAAEQVPRLAKGRAVVDFVASLTDSQAAAMLDVLSGRSGRLWTDSFVL